jgi:ABC-type arginine/histidine transport system permease subunit
VRSVQSIVQGSTEYCQDLGMSEFQAASSVALEG